MKNNDLLALVKQAQKNEPGAFEKLCKKKVNNILYVSSKIMGSVQDGEDVAQEVMLCIYNDLPRLQNAEAFNSWLYKIIIGECNKVKRKLYANEEYSMGELVETVYEHKADFIPHEYLEETEKKALLSKAIDQLKPKSKLCVLLFYYEDMSYEEIADIMNISKKEVSNLLFRAKESIRKMQGETNSSKEAKPLLQMYSASALASPVLMQLFEQEAATIAAQSSAKIVESVMAKVVLQPVAASAATATGGGVTASSTAGASAGMTTKIVSVIAAGTLLATAATTAVLYTLDNSDYYAENAVSIIDVSDSQPAGMIYVENISENAIHTLEDMIGQKNAEALRNYKNFGVSANTFTSFAEKTGLNIAEHGKDILTGETYFLYTLTKQTKMLLVITRTGDGNHLELVFRFTDAGEPLPQMDEIVASFNNWK